MSNLVQYNARTLHVALNQELTVGSQPMRKERMTIMYENKKKAANNFCL